MVASIPASAIVNVTPGVLAAGGTALDLNGLILTNGTRVPVGSVIEFASAEAVSAYFGPTSPEASLATAYFAGPDNSTLKPGALLFSQYPTAAVAGYLRGGSVASLTLAELQALTGTLTVSIDGVAKTSSTIALAAATSFSNAATIIAAAFTSLGATVTYDSVSGAFVFTSSTTGASSSVSFATGTLAAALKLTAATGAVVSAGAVAATPSAALAAVVAQSQNFATFTTTFEPDSDDKVAFAAWANGQDNRYAYVLWDTTSAPALSDDTTSAGYLIRQAAYSGTVLIWGADSLNKAVLAQSWAASLNFGATNGRTTLAFRTQSGLTADVTDQTTATNLLANGYNFFGAYGTANDNFLFFYDGSITGPFLWADSFANQIWLNGALQAALLNLLVSANAIPYNAAGYALIEAACSDAIAQGVSFGAIRAGVTLSASQIAAVNAAAGVAIGQTLTQRGWYLQVRDASAPVRAQRGSPPITFWYVDGQSVQRINLASIEVQ